MGILTRYGDCGTDYWQLFTSDIITPINGRRIEAFHNTRYRDEYVGSEWLVPQGVTAPDVVTATIGGIPYRVYAFDGNNTEERISNMFEINHDVDIERINNGEVKIEWHVHFMPSDNATAGTVKWFFDFCYIPLNGAPLVQPSISATQEITAGQQYNHLICGTELNLTTVSIGDIILFTLRRTPTNGDDDYGADAYLLKTALHVPLDGLGSRQRYIK